MRATLILVLATAAQVRAQSTTCLACVAIVGLLEQMSGNASAPAPEATCKALSVCDGTCTLFKKWPTPSISFPSDGGPVDSRRLLTSTYTPTPFSMAELPTFLAEVRAAEVDAMARGGRTDAPTLMTVLTAFLRRLAARALAAEPLPRGAATADCDGGLNITCEINRVFNDHLPLVDGDNDTFAGPANASLSPFLSAHFRGTNWRGRDCDETDAGVYPGRIDGGGARDTNCNGIYGVDAASQVPYETLFCSGADAPMGVAILGDSAAAHFHLPPQYVNALGFNLSGLLELAGNEADWPQCSWATGFRNSADGGARCPHVGFLPPEPGGAQPFAVGASIYERFAALNKCNHRDYANLGVNGARVGSMAPGTDGSFGIINGLTRSRADAPLLTIFALIGNDVCNGHPGYASMTTVDEFTASVLASLAVLNATLPSGSHVAFLGLVDGRVLYNTTQSHIHPIGVPYPDLYDALTCSNSNPCWGWLNSNKTARDFTSERAANLTAVYDTIIAQAPALNYRFDMYRINVDWVALINEYVAAGGDPFGIIEPADGFHPSQTGHALLAGKVWADLVANRPNWLPRLNPSNANISALFGDQGGY